jgi:adenine-specific DNA-methyltransferase
MLMTTDPGDLVVDPTCGSGTTAYVAEQWGRRWITIDTSRVPLALARQRLLTATYPYYELQDSARGPAGGFVYKRKQNNKGEEVGGIVPHVTLKSIANDEPPAEEVLVDRPEIDSKVTRVAGPFVVEATIPTPVDWEGDGEEDSHALDLGERGAFVDRMLEILRRVPKLQLEGNRTVTFAKVRAPAQTMVLHAEGVVLNGAEKLVAFVFGPEHGAVSEQLVYSAVAEAKPKGYAHLYVIGFAIEPNARKLANDSAAMGLVPCTYVQATPDIAMGDLLKTTRASQVFSVCGLPEIVTAHVPKKDKSDAERWQVTLLGLDTFDPVTMETRHTRGDDVPAWLLDADYDGLCFNVTQAFFPRGAWDALKRALKADFDESVFEHLAGSTSAPFEAGTHKQVAVKVIDERGNELLVTAVLK